MSGIITRFVETIFTAKDQGLSGLLSKTQKDSNAATLSLGQSTKAIADFISTAKAGAIGVVTGGFFYNTAKDIMNVGHAAEKAKISLGGILSGQGIAANFNDGLLMAESTLAKIEKDAAALPGEAEEFQQAFQTAASAIGTSGMELNAFVDMSNKMVAAGKIFGQDAEQSGRDIALLIEGRAGMDVGLWSKLAPYLQMSVSEAEKFNKLAPEKRMEKLISVVGDGVDNQGKLGDMIKAYGSTWEAISSTITGSMKTLWRVGTAPLFERGKENANKIATWLGENEGLLKTMMGGAGEYVSNMLTPATAAGLAGGILGKVAFGFGPVGMILGTFAAKSALGSKSIEQLGAMALNAAEKIGPVNDRFMEFGGVLVDELTPAMEELFALVGETAYDALSAFVNVLVENKDGIVSGIKSLASTLTWFVNKSKEWVQAGGEFISANETEAAGLQNQFGDGVLSHVLAKSLAYTNYFGAGYLDPAQEQKAFEEGRWAQGKEQEEREAIAATNKASKEYDDMLAYLKDSKSIMATSGLWGANEFGVTPMDHISMMSAAEADRGEGWMDDNEYQAKYFAEIFSATVEEALDRQKEQPLLYTDAFIAYLMEQQVASGGPKALAPKKPSVNQDFRHSRFDIKQQFPNDMDPDRVAVAFRRDIEAVGTRKLQSGITGAIMGI